MIARMRAHGTPYFSSVLITLVVSAAVPSHVTSDLANVYDATC